MNPTYDDIRVGDTVRYTGAESRSLVNAIGVVSSVRDSSYSDWSWIVCEIGPLTVGAYARNLTVVMRPAKPSYESTLVRDKIATLTAERDDLANQALELEDKQYRLNSQIQTIAAALAILEQTS